MSLFLVTATTKCPTRSPSWKLQRHVVTKRIPSSSSSSSSSSSRSSSAPHELQYYRNKHLKTLHNNTVATGDATSTTTTTTFAPIPVPTQFQETTSVPGIVEGVWIFCRHGDRAPSRCLSPPHMADEEAAFWMTKLPFPDSMGALEVLSQHYPPRIHPSNNDGQFLDVERKPFGFLTERGILQSQETGRRFFHRYNELGHHLPGHSKYLNAKDFMNVWNVQVYSTNYLRTIMSVQSFLDGMLGSNCYVPPPPGTTRDPNRSLSSKQFRIPDHQSLRKDSTTSLNPDGVPAHDDSTNIHVQVRDRAVDTLNAFDRNPDLMADLVAQVVSRPSFQTRDGDAAPLAARLANILPGLARKGRKVFGGPSNINWIEAMDHFVCRTAHQVPFCRFSDFEHDDRVDHMLAAMSHQTMAHLAWRYRQWFKSPKLLAAIAAPPLREISRQLQTTPSLGVHQKRPFVVYSCHDVTILSLLYGIGAEFLANEEKGDWRFWPPYSSTLVFELVRIKPNRHTHDSPTSSAVNTGDKDDDTHVVRVLLNGEEIRLCDLLSHDTVGPGLPIGGGPRGMLLLEEFDNLVTKLERKGGFNVVDPDSTNAKRDMSTWTG